MEKHNSIKIPVQSLLKQTFFEIAITVAIMVLASLPFIGVVWIGGADSSSNKYFYFLSLLTILFILIVILFKLLDKEEYVSDMEIKDGNLILIYKSLLKIVGRQTIPINEIKSFFVEYEINQSGIGKRRRVSRTMFVDIETLKGPVNFSIKRDVRNAKNFLSDMILYSAYIPNFSYKIHGNYVETHPYIKNEFKHIEIHGKKMTKFESFWNTWSKRKWDESLTIILLFFIFFFIVAIAFIFKNIDSPFVYEIFYKIFK